MDESLVHQIIDELISSLQETKPAPPKQERNEQRQQGETQPGKEVA